MSSHSHARRQKQNSQDSSSYDREGTIQGGWMRPAATARTSRPKKVHAAMGEKVFVAAMKGRERLDFDVVKHMRGRGERQDSAQHLSEDFFGVV